MFLLPHSSCTTSYRRAPDSVLDVIFGVLKEAILKKPKITPGIISQYRKKNIFNKMEEKEFFVDEKILE